MSRPPTARKIALAVFAEGNALNNFQLMSMWKAPRNLMYERVKRLIAAGLVVRTNPGTNPALFQITVFGKAAAEADEEPEDEVPHGANHRPSRATNRMVATTISTQPNSIFAMGSKTGA